MGVVCRVICSLSVSNFKRGIISKRFVPQAEEQQRLLADLTQSSDPERVEAELARQAVHDEKVALIHSAMLEHQEAKRALEDIDK